MASYQSDEPTSPRAYTSNRSSQWSASDTPQHHNQGTSYFPNPPSPNASSRRGGTMPIFIRSSSRTSRNGRGFRSGSITSSNTGRMVEERESDEEEEEADDDVAELQDSLNYRRPRAHTSRDGSDGGSDGDDEDEDPITVKDRQSLINVEHPFGLPIWKPALYKKSRTVTRNADEALHAIPSAQAERHLLPGNIIWALLFGWWLALVCLLISAALYVVPRGGKRYSELIFGLGWYLVWPFGKYVEGFSIEENKKLQASLREEDHAGNTSENSDVGTVRAPSPTSPTHTQTVSWTPLPEPPARDTTSLLRRVHSSTTPKPIKSYGATRLLADMSSDSLSSLEVLKRQSNASYWLGKFCFWLALVCIIAPILLIVCLICWALVLMIPMARLNWQLLKHMLEQPDAIRFCAAPPAVVVPSPTQSPQLEQARQGLAETPSQAENGTSQFSVQHPRLSAGQAAPSGYPTRTVLLCIYRAAGLQYYKYTVGGVNVLFVNLIPVVFFVIFDGLVLLPLAERLEHHGKHVPAFLAVLTSGTLIFLLSLASVIPLSYFIGMAVASISAQSSIGMGAVINATFGSIIEIILYGIALTQNKGHLVEGSIIGSILAGVLLMPGLSMICGAVRKKELKFNAKSAGVTSMMLIMAIIGTLTPTLFYQTYGNFQLICTGCPQDTTLSPGEAQWKCDSCYYQHPDPRSDPFYQSTVKTLMYFCASILVFSYLIGLWFSLRTHASQIWQNPQPLMHQMELPLHNQRLSLYQRMTNPKSGPTLNHKPSISSDLPSRSQTPVPRDQTASTSNPPPSPTIPRRVSYAPPPQGLNPPFAPVLESVKDTTANLKLPDNLSADDFTRAVAVATVSALRHQSYVPIRTSGAGPEHDTGAGGGHGGHEGPSWSRTLSASVLLACTFLYALIAEILVDVVDVILSDSGIDEKFLGVTLFALVPNTTEFMNAMSFALNGNISLSMEIGSAYALQVCLLQIPAMVAFSAWYAPERMGEVAATFSLIFPRWDAIVIILSMFLMTYTWIEAKSNYHRGSILTLSYIVLTAGFFFAPATRSALDAFTTLTNGERLRFDVSFFDSLRYSIKSLWS